MKIVKMGLYEIHGDRADEAAGHINAAEDAADYYSRSAGPEFYDGGDAISRAIDKAKKEAVERFGVEIKELL